MSNWLLIFDRVAPIIAILSITALAVFSLDGNKTYEDHQMIPIIVVFGYIAIAYLMARSK